LPRTNSCAAAALRGPVAATEAILKTTCECGDERRGLSVAGCYETKN
jgi:hypothetical protein